MRRQTKENAIANPFALCRMCGCERLNSGGGGGAVCSFGIDQEDEQMRAMHHLLFETVSLSEFQQRLDKQRSVRSSASDGFVAFCLAWRWRTGEFRG